MKLSLITKKIDEIFILTVLIFSARRIQILSKLLKNAVFDISFKKIKFFIKTISQILKFNQQIRLI